MVSHGVAPGGIREIRVAHANRRQGYPIARIEKILDVYAVGYQCYRLQDANLVSLSDACPNRHGGVEGGKTLGVKASAISPRSGT